MSKRMTKERLEKLLYIVSYCDKSLYPQAAKEFEAEIRKCWKEIEQLQDKLLERD